MKALRRLQTLGSVVVALSGGVDSSVVAALAFEALKEKAVAVTFDSPLTPTGELEDAKIVASQIGIRHLVEKLNELRSGPIIQNPPDRCYHCKLQRFRQAQIFALKHGFNAVVDGTTASDMGENRPGLRAIEELGIISPLLEVGITKMEARQIAKELNLPVASKPSNSCLATRIPYGERLSKERLSRIAAAENSIRELIGIATLRVRDHGKLARIEVSNEILQFILQGDIAKQIVEQLKSLGYEYVTLDLEGYRFGSFDSDTSQKASKGSKR